MKWRISLIAKFWTPDVLWLAPLVFLVVRPLAVWIGLAGDDPSRHQKTLIGWFGVRGIGSIYYLSYALAHGGPRSLAQRLAALVLSFVAVSILVHGVSVTPIMKHYEDDA